MSNRCVFTIVAKNYVGLANLLQKSLNAHVKDLDFFICVADELDESDYPDNVIELKDKVDIDTNLWQEMSFKYNLTEFCTAVKPFAFKYLFIRKLYTWTPISTCLIVLNQYLRNLINLM